MRPLKPYVLMIMLLGTVWGLSRPPTTCYADLVPNLLGLYADSQGNVDSLTASPGEIFTLHLLLTDPVPCDPEAVFSWCWGNRLTTSDNVTVLVWDMELCADNALLPPDFLVCCPGSFPFGTNPIRLLSLTAMVQDTEPAHFYIGPFSSDGLWIDPMYTLWDGLGFTPCFVWLQAASGDFSAPVFRVNGSTPSGSSAATWGNLKSMYR